MEEKKKKGESKLKKECEMRPERGMEETAKRWHVPRSKNGETAWLKLEITLTRVEKEHHQLIMRHDTDAGRNKTKESEFSVKRKRQNRERLQRKKVVDKREEMKLRGMLRVHCWWCRGGRRWHVSWFKGIGFAFGEKMLFVCSKWASA